MPESLYSLAEGQEQDISRVLYSYIDPRDAARACYLAATAPFPERSHTVMLIAARDHALDMPSLEFARRYYPETDIRPGFGGYQSFIDTTRAERMLGFVPQYSCRTA